ncbi:hypothetical protein [Neptuniibacter sp.]|uniref:hypothetical protein n=1 Tax=Neptuniibacter sp. TaxID=1962643 RepID=UPI0026076317|nr:hypothetical protein [Neptuniibacter sp.]MCP4598211.1 hypothetical protein [Neptuniibacter sp.]
MSEQDKHKTKRIANIVAVVFSAVIAALGVAGYQRTEDPLQLLLFLALAGLGYLIVILLFKGVNKILDSLDNSAK